MFQIDDTIVSATLIETRFACDLKACRGCCCHYGDAGAPLNDSEKDILGKIYHEIKPYLREEGIKAVEEKGIWQTDREGEVVTPLIGNEECAYAVIEEGIFLCGIEKAFLAGAVQFRKPLSCHLFPVRIKNFTDFRAVNYEEWPVCRPAVLAGERDDVYLYRFLEEPLKRAFGNEWYEKLSFAAREYNKNKWQWNR
mgnify:CR=1 FL=1